MPSRRRRPTRAFPTRACLIFQITQGPGQLQKRTRNMPGRGVATLRLRCYLTYSSLRPESLERSMYAVFEDGSRQYRVSEGDVVRLDFRKAEIGTRVEFNRVLLYQGGQDTHIG